MPEPAISKYDRDTQRFECVGLDFNRPVDSVRPGHFPQLLNVRSFQEGRIEPRYGMLNLGAVNVNQPLHSIKRLNNPSTGQFTRILGAGQNLYYGSAFPYSEIQYDSQNVKFSGDPLALVQYQPEQSPQPWMFIADRAPSLASTPAGVIGTTLKKFNFVVPACHQIGLPPALTAPSVNIYTPFYNYADPDFDFEFANNGALQAAWVADGVFALAPTLLTRVNTTIAAIKYDSGTSGWACVNATSMAQIGPGVIILVNSGGGTAERVIVQEIHLVSTATTIAAIIYDSGTSGPCSVVLTSKTDQASDVNAFLFNSTQSEYVRITAANTGQDGTVSLRFSTSGTFTVGDTVQFVGSFRAYFANSHVATETLIAHAAESSVSAGTGTLTRTANYDFSQITASVPSRPDDYIHVSFRVNSPTLVTEIRLMFDVDQTTNNFTQNYYFAAVRPSDLTSAASGNQPLATVRQNTIIPLAQVDQPISVQTPLDTLDNVDNTLQSLLNIGIPGATVDDAASDQTDPGNSQWSEIALSMSSFIRVGTDQSRGWANIAAVRVQITVTGSVTFDFDDIQLNGGFGPDQTPTSVPYLYRVRPRVSTTGAVGNPSPPTRGGVTPYRQQIIIAPSLYTSAPECDLLDIERFGGNITTWNYVGTIGNDGVSTFLDTFPDATIGGNPQFGTDNFQPWPIVDLPRNGTTGIVSGTSIKDSGTNFNLNWAQGTGIRIGGIPCTIYKVHSTSLLTVFENVGAQSAVPWNVPSPILVSQPLPCLWGPQDDTLFACGDILNPGRLYWTKGGEVTGERSFKDLTSSSEPLQNGCIYNGRSYVWSSERFFQLIRSVASDGTIDYSAQEIPGAKGMFSRWGLAVGPYIYYQSKDGICQTQGGAPQSITDECLFPLFPNETQNGTAQGGIGAPNLIAAQATNLRLNFAVSYLYYDYIGTDGQFYTLVWTAQSDYEQSGWFADIYGQAPTIHYGEEAPDVKSILIGGQNGTLYQSGGIKDDNTAITCTVQTPARDASDPRSIKYYGDIMIDADTAGVNISLTPWINNFTVQYPTQIINTVGRTETSIDVNVNGWVEARNLGMFIVFTLPTNAGNRPLLYIWEPRSVFDSAPIPAFSWEISPTTFGIPNFKSLGIGRVGYVSGSALNVTVSVDGVDQTSINLPSSGAIFTETVFRFPVYKGKFYKLRVSSTAQFRLATRDSYIEVKEWADTGAYHRLRLFGDYDYIQG